MWGGGDKDIAVLRKQASPEVIAKSGMSWTLSGDVAPFYSIPDYVNDLPPISDYFDEVDRADGQLDGRWIDVALDDPGSLYGFHSPARIPYQQRMIEELVKREGFGADDVPDMLFLNYKLTDEVGHMHTLDSEYMRDAIAAQDEALGDLVELLDRRVGEGEWVMTVTSDHGHTPDPDVSGAAALSPNRVADVVRARFDTDGDDVSVVEFTQPTMMHLNEAELAEQGQTLEDVSRFMLTLTKRDVISVEWPGPAGGLDDPAFEAVFPSSWLQTLSCVPRDD
jgi:hypothetical protein